MSTDLAIPIGFLILAMIGAAVLGWLSAK